MLKALKGKSRFLPPSERSPYQLQGVLGREGTEVRPGAGSGNGFVLLLPEPV